MTESLFIFGNGLGRSIDNDAYQLNTAMQAVWGKEKNGLSNDHKKIIRNTLAFQGDDINVGPQNEDQLKTIQEVIFACELLQKIEGIRLPFRTDDARDTLAALTKEARELPDALRTYVRQVAIQFLGRGNLDVEFSQPLIDFINNRARPVHIETTNYDDLLYETFFSKSTTLNYGLVDGCPPNVDDQLIFNRPKTENDYLTDNNTGWYLHLHGSPLYVDMDADVRKLKRSDFNTLTNYTLPGHIVLTYHEFKRRIIEESHILNAYWNIFCEKLYKSTNIILFGMSGDDEHLNDAIRANAHQDATIRVVDWCDGNDREREAKELWWKEKLGDKFKNENLVLLTNVQEFTSWALPTDTQGAPKISQTST